MRRCSPTSPLGVGGSRSFFFHLPLLPPRGGVYPSPYPLPRTQDPGFRAGLEILIATFLAISLLFFFASFFDAFLGRSWLRFPSQLASQNRPKSKKNRCQDAIHLGLRFLIDFWSVLALNLDPFDFKKHYFSDGKTRFSEKSPFEVRIDFFIPFWYQLGFILGPKIE